MDKNLTVALARHKMDIARLDYEDAAMKVVDILEAIYELPNSGMPKHKVSLVLEILEKALLEAMASSASLMCRLNIVARSSQIADSN